MEEIESNDYDILEDKNFEDILNDAINNTREISRSNTNVPIGSVKKKLIFLGNLVRKRIT